ncbi:hypothetical protein E4U41_004859 [Claviceps citrina]|nr:hypothetical protein E4U41_004859 [Claviceps citrina]
MADKCRRRRALDPGELLPSSGSAQASELSSSLAARTVWSDRHGSTRGSEVYCEIYRG